MSRPFLTEHQLESRNSFPNDISYEDMIKYFTLSKEDKAIMPSRSAAYNKLGFSLQLCALRYLGFFPLNLDSASIELIIYLAKQVDAEVKDLLEYGKRSQTKSEHQKKIIDHLGFHKASDDDFNELSLWLLERSMEHTRPSYLLQISCERLLGKKIVRPGITTLEKMVVSARGEAQELTYTLLKDVLTRRNKIILYKTLDEIKSLGKSRLTWLKQSPLTNSASSLLFLMEKLKWLTERGIQEWDLSNLTPNRIRYLSELGRKSNPSVLKRYSEILRYPILAAFLYQSVIDITDQIIEMYDRILSNTSNRAENELERYLLSIWGSTNEKVGILKEIGDTLLDKKVRDNQIRKTIYNQIPEDNLKTLIEECEKILRPNPDDYFDFLQTKYSYIRRFAPGFLNSIVLRANQEDNSLLGAVEVLQELNAENKRKVPEDATLSFLSSKWKPYVRNKDGTINRRYYEMSVLWELKNALRSGDIWAEHSRQYANIESYLVPDIKWKTNREGIYEDYKIPMDGSIRLKDKNSILKEASVNLDNSINKSSKVRIEKGRLIVSPLEAEEKPSSAIELEELISKHIPQIDLADLLIEVDSWTNFSSYFIHAAGNKPKGKDILKYLYACILTQGINMDFTRMAQSADLSYDLLLWYNGWYLREDTLKPSVDSIVNYHYHLFLSKYWGGGTLSSSDGKRYPVSGNIKNAVYLPKYYGPYKGLTYYTWSSDMFSQYGTKVAVSTIRDATYVYDEIQDNETELKILEHTTDTAGYTDLIFALFDLVGILFSPRLRDIADQRLFKMNDHQVYKNIGSLFKGRINEQLILDYWDDIIRTIVLHKIELQCFYLSRTLDFLNFR